MLGFIHLVVQQKLSHGWSQAGLTVLLHGPYGETRNPSHECHESGVGTRQPGAGATAALARCLNVESEVHDIAFLDDVLLPFQPQFSGLFGAGLALERDEVVIGDHCGADESALEIRMNPPGSLRSRGARVYRPSPHFFHSRREISL